MNARAIIAALALGATALAPAAAADAAQPKTTVTFQVTGCEGCSLRLTQALDGREKVWQSAAHTVTDGTVTWTIPTARTSGMSVSVDAPWDGGAGYLPVVAFRYAGMGVGSAVTGKVAKSKKRASACWAGTAASDITIPLTVVHAHGTNPPGTKKIRTPRAFTTITQPYLRPMNRSWNGIAGTQDAIWCDA